MSYRRLKRYAVATIVTTFLFTFGPFAVKAALAACPDGMQGWQFDQISTKTTMIGQVGPQWSSYFGNGGTQTFTTGYTGTVSAAVSVSVETSAGIAMFAQVKARVNATVSTSQSVSINVSEQQPVPKGYWGNGRYGRFRTVTTGHSYEYGTNCRIVVDHGRVTYYVSGSNLPLGWCKWVSTTSLGSQPTQCNPNHPYIA